MSDKGMLAAREATPEPAGPGGRSPSPAPPGVTALSPTAAAAAAADSSLLGEQLSGRLETVGEEGGAGGTDASASGYLASESAEAELAGGEEYDPETAFADEAPRITAGAAGGAAGGAPAPAATPTAAALDWASIKAAAAAAGHEGDGAGHALQPLKFEPLASVGATHKGGQAGAEGQREHKHHHKRERPSASPRDPEASGASKRAGLRGEWGLAWAGFGFQGGVKEQKHAEGLDSCWVLACHASLGPICRTTNCPNLVPQLLCRPATQGAHSSWLSRDHRTPCATWCCHPQTPPACLARVSRMQSWNVEARCTVLQQCYCLSHK